MYGLVNQAIERMVRTEFGDPTWERIRSAAGLDAEPFTAMQQYDDAVTYALVGAASETLSLAPADVLRAFGRYWVRFSADDYGDLLVLAGDNLRDFLLHLDEMHARVGLSFPELRPPSFRCTDLDDDGLTLHYHSEREGLADFVVGLLEGLGERFGQEVAVEHRGARADLGHDVFRVRFGAP